MWRTSTFRQVTGALTPSSAAAWQYNDTEQVEPGAPGPSQSARVLYDDDCILLLVILVGSVHVCNILPIKLFPIKQASKSYLSVCNLLSHH